MEILKTIGAKIKTRRKAKGFSQEKLGELTGLSTNYIGQIERGQRQVALDTLAKIVDVLETDLGTLFEDFRTGKKSPVDAEISALTHAARTMGLEDLKFMRKMAERLAKRG
ncbi:MAG: helix-turn-helix transcriptional regulator [Nitrospirota bacterium]